MPFPAFWNYNCTPENHNFTALWVVVGYSLFVNHLLMMLSPNNEPLTVNNELKTCYNS